MAESAMSDVESTWAFLRLLGVVFCCAASIAGNARGAEPDTPRDDFSTTAVSGSSLVSRFAAGIDWAAFGRIGNHGSLPEGIKQHYERGTQDSDKPSQWIERGFNLSGSDLYRLNCRSCHGAGGQGLPPVIPALYDPVKAISMELIQQRMAARGRALDDERAAQMAARAELGVRHRLMKGGEIMPAFAHLDDDEVAALLGFLERLVGAPQDDRQSVRAVRPAQRVGQHIISGTCLICHDATKRPRLAKADQEVPALASFPRDYSVQEFVRKVRFGSPEQEGRRGRMPLYRYLSDEELTAAYFYLTAYPPEK
jgi:mono/diheme cytochrome c family protein